jgi:hypothetical protein
MAIDTDTEETQAQSQDKQKTAFRCKAAWMYAPGGLDHLDMPVVLDGVPPDDSLFFADWQGGRPYVLIAPAPEGGTNGFAPVSGSFKAGGVRGEWVPFPKGFVLMKRDMVLNPTEAVAPARTLRDFMRNVGEGNVTIRPAETPYEMGADASLESYRKYLQRRKYQEMADKIKSSSIWLVIAMIAAIILMALANAGD